MKDFPAPSDDKTALETGDDFTPRFGPDGLITAVAVDAETGDVLMVAHMNAQALSLTIETGFAHYYSRSRKALWKKGAQSGHVQELVDLRVDCDQDCLLLVVRQSGPGACHVGFKSCFYRSVYKNKSGLRLKIDRARTYDPNTAYVEESKA